MILNVILKSQTSQLKSESSFFFIIGIINYCINVVLDFDGYHQLKGVDELRFKTTHTPFKILKIIRKLIVSEDCPSLSTIICM
jgi:hypothetical protein